MNSEKKDRIYQYLAPHLNEMIFDELSYKYLEKAGLMDILADNPNGDAVPVFKVNKPIFTEDVDRYIPTLPIILPIVASSTVVEDVQVLQIIHGIFRQEGFYMLVNWTNKTISVDEY